MDTKPKKKVLLKRKKVPLSPEPEPEPEPEPKPVKIPKKLVLKKKKKVVSISPEKPKYGKIRVGQRRMRKAYPNAEGFIQMPVWSGGKGVYKDLSPFYLGPITDQESGLVANNLENYWQYQKQYPSHVDKDGNPTQQWYDWRAHGFTLDKAVRHPMGKDKPLYLYYNGQQLGVVPARLQVYIPLYKELARETNVYKTILSTLKGGTNVMLIEPDGPPLDRFPSGLEVDKQLLDDLKYVTNLNGLYNRVGMSPDAEDKYMPYGHGYVLAEALLEDLAA